MVREMKAAGLEPCKLILSNRSKAERLGKTAVTNPPKADPALPPHLIQGQQRTPKVRSVSVVPAYEDSDASPSNMHIIQAKDHEIDPSNPCD